MINNPIAPVALEHLMKTTVTCCEQRTRLFSIYLVFWKRVLFKVHINSSFGLITYSGQILSFEDPPVIRRPSSITSLSPHDDSVLFSNTNHGVSTFAMYLPFLSLSPMVSTMKPLSKLAGIFTKLSNKFPVLRRPTFVLPKL